jgi:hypothetical protein
MRRIVNRDGEIAELYGETEDVPEFYVRQDRHAARREIERVLAKDSTTPARVRELASGVVPLPGDRPRGSTADDLLARIQERRAKARAQGSDDGMEASA